MGVIETTTNLGDGQYTVDVQRDMERATALKTKLETDIIKLEVALLQNAGAMSGLRSEIIQIKAAIDSSIDDINSDSSIPPEDKATAIREATKEDTEEFIRLTTKLDSRERFGVDGQYSIDAKTNKINAITEKLNEAITRDLWCVDYSVDFDDAEQKLSLEVGRENQVLFIAPHTYVVAQEDIDEENAVLSIKQSKKQELESEKTDAQAEKIAVQNKITYLKDLISQTQQPEELSRLKAKLADEVSSLLKWTERIKYLTSRIILAQDAIDFTQARIDALTSAGVDNVITPTVNENTKKLQPVISNGASGTYWNKALMPGIQRYMPTFRTGVITDINGDYCTVLMDETRSTQQNAKTLALFNINLDNSDKDETTPILTDVPIRYGSCNGAVFDIDDAVVISYEERDNGNGEIKLIPKVIRFTENPVACSLFYTRHALGNVYQYFIDDTKEPLFITDLNNLPGAIIIPAGSKTVIDGFAMKGSDVYSVVSDDIYKNSDIIGIINVNLPTRLACKSNDDYIYVVGLDNNVNPIYKVEKFNIKTNISNGIIINEDSTGGEVSIKVSKNRLMSLYSVDIGNVGRHKLVLSDFTGLEIYSELDLYQSGLEYMTAAWLDMFLYTTWDGSSYNYNFLTEDGVNFGLVIPDMIDSHPLLDYATYRLGSIGIIQNQLWLLTTVINDFSFWTVYALDITYDENSIPIGVSLANGGDFLFQKTTTANEEYHYSNSWIFSQSC